ncbi:AAA family ATPase [Ruegeria arenilitoris]|uniref:AAA family ATPase n=1 Tax=Ruegeria arenilitoris TaxID=1173585 RepID=UPI00147F62A3|nr:AAA family ATPase [Ruegeria arenilitoris]
MDQKNYPLEQWKQPEYVVSEIRRGRGLPEGWTHRIGQYEGRPTINVTNKEGQQFTFINEAMGGLTALPDYQERMDKRRSRRMQNLVDALGTSFQIPDLDTVLAEGSEPQEFVVPSWVPRGCLTTLYGAGGTGKTSLMLTTAVRLAVGRPVFNELPQPPAKVIFFSSEDGQKHTGRRLKAIISRLGLDVDEFETLKENLRLPNVERVEMSLVKEAFGKDKRAAIVPSAFYHALAMSIEKEKPDVVILDPLSDLFELNENDRMQVSSFLRLLHNLALDQNISIILIGHPGKSDDSEYSGSTAWNNKSRYRIWAKLDRDTGTIEIHQRKHQYTPQAKGLVARWEDGVIDVMLPEDTKMHLENRRVELANKIYDLLAEQESLGKYATTQPRADQGLIAIVLQRTPERTRGEISVGIDQLLKAKRIEIVKGDGRGGRPKAKSGGNVVDIYRTRKLDA